MSDQFHVINPSRTPIEVPIFNAATGETDSVFVQPGARPKLPPGFQVNDQFAKLNPRISVITTTESKSQAARLSNLGVYFRSAAVGENRPETQEKSSQNKSGSGSNQTSRSNTQTSN